MEAKQVQWEDVTDIREVRGMNSELSVKDLLFNDQPITINRKLAKCLGLKEAVIFQQIHYWLEINKKTNNNFKEGRYWTYNSIKKWHENEFDFLSIRTVERTLKALEKEGLLICKTFNKMAGDKTKWYTIDYDKLLEVCKNRLNLKEEKSKKMSVNGKLGAMAKKEKAQENKENNEKINTIQPNWHNGEPCNQNGTMVQPNWQNGTTKLAEAIPENTTKTSTKTTTCSSSTENMVDYFEDNICKLGTSTKKKFLNLIEGYSNDYIKAVIDYQSSINTKSYKGFETGFNNFKTHNIDTVDALQLFLDNYNKSKTKKKTYSKNTNKEKKIMFNDFTQREYDYDALEKKLLGWDND